MERLSPWALRAGGVLHGLTVHRQKRHISWGSAILWNSPGEVVPGVIKNQPTAAKSGTAAPPRHLGSCPPVVGRPAPVECCVELLGLGSCFHHGGSHPPRRGGNGGISADIYSSDQDLQHHSQGHGIGKETPAAPEEQRCRRRTPPCTDGPTVMAVTHSDHHGHHPHRGRLPGRRWVRNRRRRCKPAPGLEQRPTRVGANRWSMHLAERRHQ